MQRSPALRLSTAVAANHRQQQLLRRAAGAIASLRMASGKHHYNNVMRSSCLRGPSLSHHDVVCNKQATCQNNNTLTMSLSTDAGSEEDGIKTPQPQRNWDFQFDSLKAYKSIHGDTFVPATYPENPQLGNWVDNQRQLYRMRQEAEESGVSASLEFITADRIDKLNSIGFVWNANEHAWNLRFEELKQYISENGNACVPGIYPLNQSLGLWVAKQRRGYKVRLGGKRVGDSNNETSLSEERIEKLNEVGFIWDIHEANWMERYEELKRYSRDYGDTLVPKEYPFLGRWVDKQRSDYKRFMARKKLEEGVEIKDPEERRELEKSASLPTGMTDERIRLLETADFIFDPFTHAWEEKYNELCQFVATNGHASIRRSTRKGYDPLARWAENQRTYYKIFLAGEKTSLTAARIEKLDRIGFIWDVAGEHRQKKLQVVNKKKQLFS